MILISRIPKRAICSVRGMGVAESVKTSNVFFIFLIFSLCVTPNRCSSSIMRSPKSQKFTSWDKRRWVPMTMSTSPFPNFWSVSFCSEGLRKRESEPTTTGNCFNRSWNTLVCWSTKSVVGASTATCFLSMTALKAARMATSVFPYPTSPHTIRSMGFEEHISERISSMVLSWSGVSS